MGFIETPNLPETPVSCVVVDGRVQAGIEKSLLDKGVACLKTKAYPGLYEAVAYHPDIMLHHIRSNKIVYAPDVDKELLDSLEKLGFLLMKGQSDLSGKYPGNIAYNVARVGHIAFHNKKYTDPVLKAELEKAGVELIHINQGYSKCSICVVDEKAIITSDVGIARTAEKTGVEVLLLEGRENILLPGLDCGFIGGSTGKLNKNVLAIAGSLNTLTWCDKILEFVNGKGIKIVSLSNGPVTDIGSILPITVA